MSRPLDRRARQVCAPRPRRSRTRRPRLLVQTLEDRTTPAQIPVTSLADDGQAGTLRATIDEANATPEADEIVFDAGLFGTPQTINLALGALPTILDAGGDLTITGPGAAKLTVNAGGNSGVFDSFAKHLTLTGFTVANGKVDQAAGGGLAALNSVVLDGMQFTGNSATGGGFNNGSGGAIGMRSSGALTVRNSIISGNTADQNGGGIYFYSGGSLLVVNSTISGNSTATATDPNRGGGGIYFYGPAANLTIVNSTIAGNSSASSGGGVLMNGSGPITVLNSTVVGNTAANAATGQGGGGLAVTSGGATIVVANSIVSGNSAATAANGPDIRSANTVTVNFSAMGDPVNGFTLSGGVGNLTGSPAALLLGPLTDNQGPTPTMAPAAGSPLIDAGSNALIPTGLTTDQRGSGFARVFATTVDIGAVEVQPLAAPFADTAPPPVTAPTAGAYTFDVTFEDSNGTNNGVVAADLFNVGTVVRVTGPNGFDQLATYVGPAALSDGTPLTVTYSITPPGGGWDASEDGTYSVSIEPNAVHDFDGNVVPAGPAGTIGVLVPRTLTVTNADDSGPGSLRDAITQAAAIGADDTIEFDPTFFGSPRTISLQSVLAALPPDSGALTITGPGTGLLTVRRDPDPLTPAFRIFESDGAALTLTGFTVSGGVVAAGAAAGFGTTVLDHMVFTGNHAAGNNPIAGALFFGAGQTATMTDCAVTDNSSASVGGAILVATGASLTITDSTVSNNSAGGAGGAIFVNDYASLTLTNCTISGNTAAGRGGGIYARRVASVSAQGTTISGNSATGNGGGIFLNSGAVLSIAGSTISGNSASARGGGLYFFYNGSLDVQNSTISGNSTSSTADGDGGGGLYFYGTAYGPMLIQNSTIANNHSASSGGAGLLKGFAGTVQIINSTVSGNTAANTNPGQGGGGFAVLDGYYQSTGAILLQNSVISGNSNANGSDFVSVETSGVYAYSSLIFDPAGFTLVAGDNNLPVGTDPRLGPLQDNGGPTLTMAPLAGSPLLDAGDNIGVPPEVTTDQRGFDRLDPATGAVDIGAVEAQAAIVTIAVGATQPPLTNDPTAVVFDVVFDQPVTGFDGTDVGIDLRGSDPTTGPLQATVTKVTPTTYTVIVTAVTGNIGDGDVVAAVLAGTATVGINASGQGNLQSAGAATVTVDSTAPTAVVTPAAGQRDPTNDPAVRFLVQFGEDVTGFDAADVLLTSTGGDTLTPTVSAGPDPNSFFVDVAGVTVSGTITAAVRAGAVQDAVGNDSAAGSGQIVFDIVPPTVAVSLSAGQPSSTGGGTASTISFDVRFDEDVNFTAADVDLAGSPPGTHVLSVTPAGLGYTVLLTGMTSSGTVTLQIDANAVADLAGNTNTDSSSASVTFINSGTVQFSSPTYAIDEEGEPTLLVTVTRTGASDGSLDVTYTITDGSAHAGTDYAPQAGMTGTLHWDAGNSDPQPIAIDILDDGDLEPDSTFTIDLSAPTVAGALGAPATATVTIREQAVIAFTSGTFLATEVAGSDTPFDVTVARQANTRGTTTVHYLVTAGTATEGVDDDYTVLAESDLTWDDGETVQSIHFTINDDALSEGRETINIVLSNPAGDPVLGTVAVLGTQRTAVLTIDHNDGKAAGTKFSEDGTPLGDQVTPRLAGRVGTLTYYLTNGVGPISEMVLDGTDAVKSVVTLTVTKPLHGTGDGRVQIGEIKQINGTGVKTLSLGKADLVGAGIDVAGFLGSLVIGDVKNGADIQVHGAPPLKPVTAGTRITAGQILGTPADPSDITFDDPGARGRLTRLSAISVGEGTITAATVGTILTRGKAQTKTTGAILGDFASDLVVNGPSLAPRSPALGTLKLVTGSVPAGVVITAPTIGTIRVSKGDFAGTVTANGTGIDPAHVIPALRTLYVGGKVTGSTIQLGGTAGTTGNVGSVSVGWFENSRLFAGNDGSAPFNTGTVGSFTVRAVKGATNQFAQSFVVAQNFRTVSLATADTATGPDFGFVFDGTFGSLILTKSPTGKKVLRNITGTQQVEDHLVVTKAP